MSELLKELETNKEEYGRVKHVKAHDAYYSIPFDNLPLEKNRYTLIWLPACPRAQRVATTVQLLGLTEWIDTIELAPRRLDNWEFSQPLEGHHDLTSLFSERKDAIQPCLYDKQHKSIITNDQYNLSTLFATYWLQASGFDSYPVHKRPTIDRMSGFIFKTINVQIYRAGHEENRVIKKQEETKLAQTFQLLNQHLSDSHFLLGEQLTDADLRLFPSLIRCPIYEKQFNLLCCRLEKYPHLLRYVQELYQLPSLKQTTKLEQIVDTHFRSPHNLQKFGDDYSDETVSSIYRKLLTTK